MGTLTTLEATASSSTPHPSCGRHSCELSGSFLVLHTPSLLRWAFPQPQQLLPPPLHPVPTGAALSCLWLPPPPCPLLARADFCAPGQPQEQTPVCDPHTEMGLKPQLSPRGCVTKEEKLKSLLTAVHTED